MKIGIMSDSHDHLENIKKCVQLFQSAEVEYVIHLGDFVSPNSIRACNGIKLVGIFGNNDGDKFRLVSAFNAVSGELKGDFHEFTEDGLKFACYHGTELAIKDALIACETYDVVLHGHSHACENTMAGNTLVLNPGTLHGFGNRATVMIFDTKSKKADLIDLKIVT
jgi:putative phosphoesterase